MDVTFAERLEQIRARVARACARARREPESVLILPVSKNQGPEQVRAVAECGLQIFGENKVQEARHKIPLCPGHLSWHFIGHLQSNKVREAVHWFAQIHSVDSLRILQAIEQACSLAGREMPVLLEVNVSGESSKFGLEPEQVPAVLEAAVHLQHVQVRGLMTMPPLDADPEHARPYFQHLRELRDLWRSQSGFDLDELSMGMSNDFEVAIEEGATCIRLGTIIFGARQPLSR